MFHWDSDIVFIGRMLLAVVSLALLFFLAVKAAQWYADFVGWLQSIERLAEARFHAKTAARNEALRESGQRAEAAIRAAEEEVERFGRRAFRE